MCQRAQKQYFLFSLILISTVVICCVRADDDGPEARAVKQKSETQPGKRSMFMQVIAGKFSQPETPESRSKGHKKMPDMSRAGKACPKKSFYFAMNPSHMDAVEDVIGVLKSAGHDPTDSLGMAMQLRKNAQVNPRVWYRALSNFAYANPMFESMVQPLPVQTMPDVFIPAGVMKKMRDEAELSPDKQSCVILDESVSGNASAESCLWYFREDVFLNAHHWFYHIANPFRIVENIDRRGELFYFMHHQMMARYNAERLSHGFQLTTPFKPVKDIIVEEAYFPNLADTLTGSMWTGRAPSRVYTDVLHGQNPDIKRDIYIKQLETYAERINESIEKGFLLHENGTKIPMKGVDEMKAINTLGDLMQASNQSINLKYYGELGLHNNGHLVIGLIMDPLYKTMLPPGVMTDEGTAIRDPIFYRWHTFIDQLFNKYQKRLEPYKPSGGNFCPLLWPGIKIIEMEVMTPGLKKNELHTFFTLKSLNLPRGLDYAQIKDSDGTLKLCAKHLDHKGFSYRFVIEREPSVKSSKATIRVFMAPRFKGNGKRFSMEEQRELFFVMDTFTVNLKPGRNTIQRKSTQSSVTINPHDTLDELEELSMTAYPNITTKQAFCGCGWPQHLLLPRGSLDGQVFDLFVMVTDGVKDEVKDDLSTRKPICRSPYVLCGIPGRKYPDSRPMNFPFDRLPYKDASKKVVANLDQYINNIGNMGTMEVVIKHMGVVKSKCCDKFKKKH